MEKKWLVKINNEIQGPFTLEELKEMASQKELSFRDEVNISQRSWVYAHTIEELWPDSSKKTSTDTDLFKKTDQVNQIKDENYKDLEEIKKHSLSEEFDTSLEGPVSDEVTYVSLEDKKKLSDTSSIRFANAKQIKEKTSLLSRTIWQVVVVVFVLGVVGVIWLDARKKQEIQQEPIARNIPQFLNEARSLFEAGMYKESFGLFVLIFKEDESLLETEDWMRLSELSLYKMGRIYEARIFLEKAQNFDNFNVERGYLLTGVIEFLDGNKTQAIEAFKQASSSEMSLAYQFILYIREKNLVEAQNILNELKNSTPLEKFLSLAGVNLFSLEGKEESVASLEEGKDVSFEGEYAQEMSFVTLKENIFQNTENEAQKFLNQDPYLIEEFQADLLFPSEEMIWKYLLLDSCSSWFHQREETAYSLTLHAFCQIKSGLQIEAQNSIEKGMKLHPKDPLVLSVYYYVFSKNSSDPNQIYIDRALSVNEGFVLPFILKARSCQKQQDYECAYENWKLVSDQSKSIYSQEAWALYFLGDTQQAFEIAEEGIKRAPSYLPFRQILLLKNKN